MEYYTRAEKAMQAHNDLMIEQLINENRELKIRNLELTGLLNKLKAQFSPAVDRKVANG